jgi:hypothetical protein
MARISSLTLAVLSLSFLTLFASGCTSNSTLAANIPSPNFNGPSIQPQRAAPTPAPVVPKPAPAPRGKISGESAWVPSAPPRAWKWIVIHHSATPSGSAGVFDQMHRDKGWDELGYHFVVGNGTQSGNGQIEVGPRWPKQKWGAHAKTPDNRYNDFGIGICLVGNFDIERPTPQQLQSVARLVSYLMKTYRISASNVLGHGDTKPTDCPGRNLSVAQIRRMATQILVDAGEEVPGDSTYAGNGDLLQFDQPGEASVPAAARLEP